MLAPPRNNSDTALWRNKYGKSASSMPARLAMRAKVRRTFDGLSGVPTVEQNTKPWSSQTDRGVPQ